MRPMPGASPTARPPNGTRGLDLARRRLRSLRGARQLQLDPQFGEFQWVGEIERRYDLWGHPGKIAVTGFLTRGRMGRFRGCDRAGRGDRRAGRISPPCANISSRGGVSLNVEQEITDDLGVFARAGWANGNIEPYEFTDIDRTVAAGFR